jgi:hypothetical protein
MRMRREMTPLEKLLKRALLSIVARNLDVNAFDWSRQAPRENLAVEPMVASFKEL